MEIRDERPGDEEAIRRVHRDAFGGDLEARLVDLLRERGKAVTSLVADDNGQVVGHIVFSEVTIDAASECRALGLGPLSVLPAISARARLDNQYGVNDEFMGTGAAAGLTRPRARSRSLCVGVRGSVKVRGRE